MCSIIGALLHNLDSDMKKEHAEKFLEYIMQQSLERGRDGFGWHLVVESRETILEDEKRVAGAYDHNLLEPPCLTEYSGPIDNMLFVSNLRAEPTTEYVLEKRKSDQQPYSLRDWVIVHNGTIANDKELRSYVLPTSIDSAAIVEHLCEGRPEGVTNIDTLYQDFCSTVKSLVGSYAILAGNLQRPDTLFVAANYRPVWYCKNEFGVFFASAKDYFPPDSNPIALPPYSTARFRFIGTTLDLKVDSLYKKREGAPRALVVASGGLDSTVAAAECIKQGYEVGLIHFTYGCRAEGHEVQAVRQIAEALGVLENFLPLDIYNPEDSRLFDPDCRIAGGEEGSEFAHEWVPARNLVMLSVATAIAEAEGFDYIVLGNNLEEAGAYPDNEPEFISRFNDILPFAVGAGKRVQVIMPVGNLMKHEIVSLGYSNGAPLHLTWSCYKNGEKHCGKCGPCFMRKTAFSINNINEVIEYEE